MTEAVQKEEGLGTEKEIPAIEVKAREMGWRPKEEFHGNEDDFVDAKEFVQRQPLFEKIETQSRQLKNVQKTLDALKEHHTKVREAEYKRALAALEAQKEAAINEANGTQAVAVERQIKQVEREFEQIQREHVAETPANDPQEFVSWKAKNAWYEQDEAMRVFADAYGTKLAKEKGMSPSEVLTEVTKKVRAEFGHKTYFRNPNKDSAPDVETSRGGNSSKSSDRYELTEQERSIMNTLVRSGTLTKEQYIEQLKAVKASR